VSLALLAVRSLVGGVLMGLANLVPGISGGTMLLAAGIYPRFIAAIAEISTLRFRRPSLVVLGAVGLSALVAIGGLAGVVKDLVVNHRWVMYAIFIGLTLGGLPLVWRLARPLDRSVWLGAGAGFVVMAALAVAQTRGLGTSAGGDPGWLYLLLGGVAGASAMILPGVSGGYLLLVLGQYVAILGGIHAVMVALKAGDLAAAWGPAVHIVLPVGIGVVVGVVGVSNLLKLLLTRHEKPTLGVLLGLLVGAVMGLWPFQAGVRPEPGDVVRGQTMTRELIDKLAPDRWPTAYFTPTALQVVGALALVGLGFAATALIARFGREEE
jgi:putative membrane protein